LKLTALRRERDKGLYEGESNVFADVEVEWQGREWENGGRLSDQGFAPGTTAVQDEKGKNTD